MQQKSGLRKNLSKAIKSFDFSDYVLVVGAGLAFYGIFRIYQPAAYIALGAGLIYWAIRIELVKKHDNPSKE